MTFLRHVDISSHVDISPITEMSVVEFLLKATTVESIVRHLSRADHRGENRNAICLLPIVLHTGSLLSCVMICDDRNQHIMANVLVAFMYTITAFWEIVIKMYFY